MYVYGGISVKGRPSSAHCTLKHYRASSRRLRDFTISEQCHWELNFYKTYNLLYSYCTLIYCENSSPIYLSKNPILHSYINIYI